MKKILILALLFSQSSCELLQKNKKKPLDCSNIESFHPKHQATCILKIEIDLLRNKKVTEIVESYTNIGLRNSAEYNVSLMSGGGDGDALSWTYLVSVNFNDLKKYQSIVGLVEVSASKPPKLLKVLRGEKIK